MAASRPSPEQPVSSIEALLLSLLREDPDLGLESVGTTEERGLIAALENQRLLPLFGERLCARLGGGLSAAFHQYVDKRREVSRLRGFAHETVGHAVLDELASRSVRACWLKGPQLARRVHGDVALRESTDVDLLVAPEDLEHAVSTVAGMGWTISDDWQDRKGRPSLHFALGHPKGLPPVEIHWRVHWYEERYATNALDRGRDLAGEWVLGEADLLAFLLLFYARDGLAGLRLVADALALLHQAPEARDGVLATVEEAPELEKALTTAMAGVEQLAPGAFPGRAGGDRTASSWALAVSDPMLRASMQQRRANQALVDILLAPRRGRAGAVRRNVVPPWAVLRQQQPALRNAGPARLVTASAEHGVRSLRRLGLALRSAPTGGRLF